MMPYPAATECPLCLVAEPTSACRFCGFTKSDGRDILEAQRIKIEAGWDALSHRQQELLRRWDQ
jgi:hypothetical protein